MNAFPAPNLRRAPIRVLITGGCGFVGCNLADALAARGRRVLLFDVMRREGAEENLGWLKARRGERVDLVVGDVRDADAVADAVADATAVLHLAAQVAVTTSLVEPLDDFAINAAGTLNVLEAVRSRNPSLPVIFASTNKVYGKLTGDGDLVAHERRYRPSGRLAEGADESTPLDFYSPYGCSKGAADQYVRDYARVFGLRTVVMRMSCIYGPRQFGTEDQGWLAHFVLKTLRGEPITIYGDGRQVRDALFIDDAVEAWLGALERIDAISGRVFNLGGGPGNDISLLEALDLIGEIRGLRPQLHFAEWRPGDQPWYVSDIRAVSAALDWAPRTRVPEGLRQLDQWLSDRFGAAEAAPQRHEAIA